MMTKIIIDIIVELLHHLAMRTTINLDYDVLSEVRRYAKDRSVALGRAVSELLRRGLEAELPTKMVNGLCVVDLPRDTPVVRHSRIRELESEE